MPWGAAGVSAAANILGGIMSNESARRMATANYLAQKEFAQHGVRWRVEDARAAGLHLLAALGVSGASFSPIAIQDSLGPALASAGQDISRAMLAGGTAQERAVAADQAFQLAAGNAEIEGWRFAQQMAAGEQQMRLNERQLQLQENESFWRIEQAKEQIRRSQHAAGMPPSRPDVVPPRAGEFGPRAGQGPSKGQVDYVPPEVPFRRNEFDTHIRAGTEGMWIRKEVRPGVFVDYPSSADSELLNLVADTETLIRGGFYDMGVGDWYVNFMDRKLPMLKRAFGDYIRREWSTKDKPGFNRRSYKPGTRYGH